MNYIMLLIIQGILTAAAIGVGVYGTRWRNVQKSWPMPVMWGLLAASWVPCVLILTS